MAFFNAHGSGTGPLQVIRRVSDVPKVVRPFRVLQAGIVNATHLSADDDDMPTPKHVRKNKWHETDSNRPTRQQNRVTNRNSQDWVDHSSVRSHDGHDERAQTVSRYGLMQRPQRGAIGGWQNIGAQEWRPAPGSQQTPQSGPHGRRKRREEHVRRIQQPLLRLLQEVGVRGDWKAAEMIILDALTSSDARDAVDVHVYAAAMAPAAKNGQWESALRIMDKMKEEGVVPNQKVYNEAIHACGNGGEWKRATSLLREMSKHRWITPNVVNYNTTITACGNSGQWAKAIELLRVMRSKDARVKPTVVTYTAAMTACGKCGQWEKAVDLLREMQSTATSIRPDAFSYSAAISACGTAGQGKKALDLLREMEAEGSAIAPNVHNFNAAIAACGNSGEWEEALLILTRMQRAAKTSDIKPNAISYTGAIIACGKAGRPEQAMTLLRLMKKEGIPPHKAAFNAAIAVCETEGNAQQALDLLLEMRSEGGHVTPDVGSYISTIKTFRKVREWVQAMAVFTLMRKDGVSPDDEAYDAAIAVCREGRNLKEAEKLEAERKREKEDIPSCPAKKVTNVQ